MIRYNQCHGCEESLAHGFQKASHVDLWLALQALEPSTVDCANKTLFRRGEPCRGLYMVQEGSVRLLLAPHGGGSQEFETVGAGAVLGLAETMTGGEYRLTAEAADGARIGHIDRAFFLDRLQQDQQLCMKIVQLLSEDLHALYHRFIGMFPGSGKPDPNLPH